MKGLVIISLLFLSNGAVFGGETVQGGSGAKVLLIYEESNSSLDPWRELFRAELSKAHYLIDEKSASQMQAIHPSDYDFVIIYGAVMAFTAKEPLRDWLQRSHGFPAKKVNLFVTAGRWFATDYQNKLVELLKKRQVLEVDAVSAATQKLTPEEKQSLVHTLVARLN